MHEGVWCRERECRTWDGFERRLMRYLCGMGDMGRVTATGMGRCGYETMGLVAMG